MIVEGRDKKYEVVVGIEVHAQLSTSHKLFSSAKTDFGSEPNSQVALVDIAFPGMLPVLNFEAVRKSIAAGLGMCATINKNSRFDRKHYFYPDLPQGYQITQLYSPIILDGHIDIDLEDGATKTIRVERAHIEQDAGKLVHDLYPNHSCVDLNRAGIPLLEIVSAPDIRSPYEACEYVKNLRAILRAVDASDGDMEKGSFRCDVNISVRPSGESKFGTRCEIKNVNSIRSVARAIEYEARRHVEVIENGGKINQETRLFNADTGETRKMRSKEDADDYRYFPDPDLRALVLSDALIDEVRSSLPELPRHKRDRYIKNLGLSIYDASVLTSDDKISQFFEIIYAECKDAKLACTWITSELFGRFNKLGLELETSKITAQNFALLLLLIKKDVISGKIAKDVLDTMIETGENPEIIVSSQGLTQVTDESEIIKIIDKVLLQNQDKVAEYRSGKDKMFGFFVGQTMKEMSGKGNPAVINKILIEKLKS